MQTHAYYISIGHVTSNGDAKLNQRWHSRTVRQKRRQPVDSFDLNIALAHIQRQQLIIETPIQHIDQMIDIKIGYGGLAQSQVLELLTVAQNSGQDTGVITIGTNVAPLEADVAQVALDILKERSQRNIRWSSFMHTVCERPLHVDVTSIRVVDGFALDADNLVIYNQSESGAGRNGARPSVLLTKRFYLSFLSSWIAVLLT